jgi:pimeloyl-ACP methyl ester carboxylesterase
MSHRALAGAVLGLATLLAGGCGGKTPTESTPSPVVDRRPELRAALQALVDQSTDPYLRLHYQSILMVMEAGDHHYNQDDEAIASLWSAFTDTSTPHSPRLRESYLDRSRPLTIAWTSPTDGQVSFLWLTLPAGWDPEREYPVYLQLHGLWDVAANHLPYLAYPYSNPGSSYAFEDGYLISPWGRGNQWYRGIAETDIWEGLARIKSLVHVNESRQYLCGHSMGGYGAWHIAQRSAEVWAALGVHAGALGYDTSELSPAAVGTLRSLPTYFVVGNEDGLLSVNQSAFGLLREAGNSRTAFVTFPGGHDYRQTDVEQMYLWLRQFENDRR